jgi:hypothetical protein
VSLLIRRSGQVVQDRPSMVVGWADIPELSTCVGCCSAAWLQSWLQSRRNGADPRPSAFQAAHIPSRYGSRVCSALSLVAAACRWSLRLLSPLLSTRRRPSGSKPTSTMQGMVRVRSRQALACPWFLTGVFAEAPGSSVTSRVRSPSAFQLCSLSDGHGHA